MLLRCLKAELVKFRRSPVWLAFVLLPVFPAILGTGNYLGNLQVLDDAWYSLWSPHTLFSSMFFLPALLGVFCAWQWRLEHTDHSWNSFLTPPVAFGLAGGIVGLLATAQGLGYVFPYSLLCVGMRANNLRMELDCAPFWLSAGIYTVVFTSLAIRRLQRHDAAAE